MAKKILFIGGSLNQTTQMHKIASEMTDHQCFFTPFYCDGFLAIPRRLGLMDRSIAGFGRFWKDTTDFIRENKLRTDFEGNGHDYDLVVTCTDLIVQNNIRNKKIILVQEGMTDPENWVLRLVRTLGLPNWLAVNTAATGRSNIFQKFCVASEGYRQKFIESGVKAEKLAVTGIPNYDHAESYYNNDIPYKNYVLVATSDTRESFKYENRRETIERAKRIADGRRLIFKLHPNEDHERATQEIRHYAPQAIVYRKKDVHELIANSDVLITKYSTVVYTGMALNKKVYSDFNLDELKSLTPIQNGGSSARNIANICREYL